jgi:hypothetical protein
VPLLRAHSLLLSLAPGRALLSQPLANLARRRTKLFVLLVVVCDRTQEQDRLALRRAVVEADHREPAHGLVVVVRGELVQERAQVVDEPGMVTREELERDQRRASARGALVLEPAPQELRFLPVPELSDRPVCDGALAVVRRTDRSLELVLPLRPQLGQLALRALFCERGRLGSG